MTEDPRSKAELTRIMAREILDKIQKGEPVEYDHVRIIGGLIGGLDLSKLDLLTQHLERNELQKRMAFTEDVKIVRSAISITNSSIQVVLDFGNATFSKDVIFEGTTFSEDAGFDGATFSRDAVFDGATFSWAAVFDGATFSNNVWFRGATFSETAVFDGETFSKDVMFDGATFSGAAVFSEVTFSGAAVFDGATFSGAAMFDGATFSEASSLFRVTFNGDARFNRATFSGAVLFDESTFSGDAEFDGATFSGDAVFDGTTFSWAVLFDGATFSGDARFDRATFSGDARFNRAKLEGDVLTFRDATFVHAISQERASRRAKNVLAKAGNRDEEEYHFYREMEAKRIQKGIKGNSGLVLGYLLLKAETGSFWKFFFYDVLEFVFVQKIFGYGVHPFRLFGWWLVFVVIFAVIYSINGAIEQPDTRQWYDYLWFSIATAATPGYALYKPLGLFKIIAGIEAILGTFMWAAFITTFARKFSR